MTILYYITGSILLLIACIVYGMWMADKNRDASMTYTVCCSECEGNDIENQDEYYQCSDCGSKYKK